ncbi:hypothetical protein QE152_g9289 [Popillia japonica]|uniref:TOG domain-containing protein n=1 Tax=Popillia japonica TaxID=7064 RepID=A0AAW1LZY5_POPJA
MGNQLSPGELKHITEIFTRMFMDSHTKGVSVFLDTLNEIIKRYKHDLNDWLYVLLQRIFHKMGIDLLNSTHNKLLNTLDNIKKSFPMSLQLTCVYRFLVDATQTPNAKTKVAVLNYLTSLCHVVDNNQFVIKSPAAQALQKIIAFAQDTKSVEIRNAAKICIVALWNCNTPQVTMMLAELPKDQQEIASNVVQSHMRKSSTGSEPGSPLVGSSPKALSPSSPPKHDDFNQEEIYKSLRKTTAEIQNYSYETLGSKLDHETRKDTTSQDSGISQMSLGNDIKNDVAALEERMEELTIRQNYASTPGTVNGVDSEINGFNNLDDLNGEALVSRVLTHCQVDNPTDITEKRTCLSRLATLIRRGQTEYVVENFKKLLRLLLDNLGSNDTATLVLVLQILTEIFNNPEMKQCWSNFVELLTLRVLQMHCHDKREVVKTAETTAAAMSVFPFTTVVCVLSPLIHTSSYPTIQGAIKMLTKMVEMHPDDVTDEHLALIMQGLVKANDHEESPVRKSAVFCMVALHKAVGEERLMPHISGLAGSKLKLLRLYISRAQASSVPTSPKNSATS